MTKAEREEAEAKEGLITKTRELYKSMNEYQKSTGKPILTLVIIRRLPTQLFRMRIG